jgi:hypothetical protein
MREKLNESKAAQAGLVAVLAIVAILFFMHSKGGGSSEETAVAPEEGAVVTETLPVAETSGGAGAIPTAVPPVGAPPRDFTAAYEADRTVVLLFVHDGGIDDEYTEKALHEVAGVEDADAFVVPAKKISDYASITVGLNVTQVPAMIVLRPRNLSHGEPQGTVLYGYQTPASVAQAIREASYVGPENSTYHPE